MPKLIVSIDGIVIKEVQLTKDRTTLGRRPYNDIVIDNLAVSGEHAVVQMQGNDVFVEDLNSTNGTYLNGKITKKQALHNHDHIEIGKYRIEFVLEGAEEGFEKTMIYKAPSGAAAPASASPAPSPAPAATGATKLGKAAIRVLSGAASGREVKLVKVVTTIGKPGVAVAAITHRPNGYVISHAEGVTRATLNATPLGDEAVALQHGDLLELGGTQMQFVVL